jgi:hypothetical protein
MWMALTGFLIGICLTIIVLGICATSGRSELEMQIMELENILADKRAELVRLKMRDGHDAG